LNVLLFSFFLFNDTATTAIYTLSLHDALPISYQLSILKELVGMYPELDGIILDRVRFDDLNADFSDASKVIFEEYIGETVNNFRSEEHTSELQSRENLVCRLLLEKKNNK